jgi:hypothetical protein
MANDQFGASYAPVHRFVPTTVPLAFESGPFSHPNGALSDYLLPSGGSALDPHECEDPRLEAVEVTVLWGANVLSVAHLAPPRPFYVGHGDGVDYLLPPELAPLPRASIVELDAGTARAVAPAGASVVGDEVHFGEIRFRIARVTAGKRLPRALAGDARGLGGAFVASVASVAAFLGALAYYTPALGASLDDELDRDRIDAMRVYLNAQAERERERERETGAKNDAAPGGGDPGQAARGPEGKMGRPDRPALNRRTAIAGVGERVLPRESVLKEAQTFGMIGMLASMNARALPSALWGADAASGADAHDAWGELFGAEPGESAGLGGLELSGIGSGAGERGDSIGLGRIGTCGGTPGSGCGVGVGGSFGMGVGRVGGSHHSTGPRVTPAGTTVTSGHLPPEVIQRTVRQNYGRFRACYESGLRTNPNLSGRVTARFIIGREGAVTNAANGGSDLPDSSVVSCVLSQFYGLSFPSPENGIVTVSYPIMFTPN